jgi:hypothetical protein
MHDLKKLFEGVHHLSVSTFRDRIAALPPAKQKAYCHKAFECSLQGFDGYSDRYRSFFCRMVHAYRQDFLHYLQEKTVMGQLRYPPQDGELLMKMVYLMEQGNPLPGASSRSLAFALILSFGYDLKINTMNQYMKIRQAEPSDLADLLEMLYSGRKGV